MFSQILPYAEAVVGAAFVVLAILIFLPMKRFFAARPPAKQGSLAIGTEMTVVAWIALLLIGFMLLGAAVQ